MPSFTIALTKKQVVYNLYQEIIRQYASDTLGVPVAAQWPEVSIQSDFDNAKPDGSDAVIFTGTDAQLSGLRHGRVLKPGDILRYNPGEGKFMSTTSIFLFSPEVDGLVVNVDLIGSFGYDPAYNK
jgi:hypothetical protein